MKRTVLASLLLLALTGAGSAVAQGRWRDMPPEDRRQMRELMREQWQQRESMRQEEPPRWRDVPPEDRQRMRDEMREQSRWREPRDGRGGGRGWRRD